MNMKQTSPGMHRAAVAVLVIFGWLPGLLLAAVQAHLDRSKVYEGDPVTLVIESDGHRGTEPDLAPLSQDFNIAGTGTSTQVSIINGRRSDKTVWRVQLEPRKLGKLEIPPISVGKDQTRPLQLEVSELPEQLAQDINGHAFLEAEVDTGERSVYVQQQIPYTLRLYYDGNVTRGDIRAPQPDNAVVEQLGEDKRYSVVREDRRYNVIERHFAISPESSGSLHIPAAVFQGEVASAQPARSFNTLNDQFLERFFSNSPFGAPGKPLRVRSSSVDIDVKPRPASASGNWLPAEGLELTDSWENAPPAMRGGEPASRIITVRVKGLTGPQIPALDLAAPPGMRLYPETPTHESRTDGETVYGISRQRFTYIPERAGEINIPAVQVQWWSTRSDTAETAQLPAWQMNVLPGSSLPDVEESSPPVETGSVKAADTAAGIPEQKDAGEVSIIPGDTLPVVAIVLLLLTAMVLASRIPRRSGRVEQVKPSHPAGPGRKVLMKDLKQACQDADAHSAARSLLALGRWQWPQDPPASLGELAARLANGQEEIQTLDRALYSAAADQWNGQSLWQVLQHGLQPQQVHKADSTDGIRPLYPHQA